MHKSVRKKAAESIIKFLTLEIEEIIFYSSSHSEHKQEILRYFSEFINSLRNDITVLNDISSQIYGFDIETDTDGCTFLQSIMKNHGVLVEMENNKPRRNSKLTVTDDSSHTVFSEGKCKILEEYIEDENNIKSNSNHNKLPSIKEIVLKNRDEREITRKNSKKRTEAFRAKLNSYGGTTNDD